MRNQLFKSDIQLSTDIAAVSAPQEAPLLPHNLSSDYKAYASSRQLRISTSITHSDLFNQQYG